MILDTRHIEYLRMVAEKKVALWWNPARTFSKFVCTDWGNGRRPVDQSVAAQMKALGLTVIRPEKGTGKLFVTLTERGENVLQEEDEAWA